MKQNIGLTLIKLVPAAAMIAILAALAVPSYLGTLKVSKIPDVRADTKVSLSEAISALESEITGGPFTRLGSGVQEECFASDAVFSEDTCQSTYTQSAESTCSAYPSGMTERTCAEFAYSNNTVVPEK